MTDGSRLRQIQHEHREWALRNFGEHPAYFPLLGAVEELGELAHCELKSLQGIRGSLAEHETAARDALADVVIFLLDYASVRGWDFQEVLEETWVQVRERDWRANPVNGRVAR